MVYSNTKLQQFIVKHFMLFILTTNRYQAFISSVSKFAVTFKKSVTFVENVPRIYESFLSQWSYSSASLEIKMIFTLKQLRNVFSNVTVNVNGSNVIVKPNHMTSLTGLTSQYFILQTDYRFDPDLTLNIIQMSMHLYGTTQNHQVKATS